MYLCTHTNQNKMKNLDDIKDASIEITNKLIELGIIPDCTDTDNETEFEVQDAIREVLCKRLQIEND